MVDERTAALRAEKALADTIIETLPGLFFVIDGEERLVRWNAELEKVSGLLRPRRSPPAIRSTSSTPPTGRC